MGCVSSRIDIEAEGRQFRIKRMVASGGFSQIFLAEDLDSGERVAVKKIVCHGPLEVERASAEIRFLTRFSKHSHILPLLAVTEDRAVNSSGSLSLFSLIFPFCQLGSLDDELAQRRHSRNYMSQRRIIFLLRQICSAIEVLHTAKPPIAHRDIKPANLMFCDERTLQLIDFGSATECPLLIETARDSRRMLDEAAELCTMPYRAPELFTCEIGATIEESVDIWSLGCVLYALCYFSSPFDEVHVRGDSVALAVQSAKLNFNRDAPFDLSLAELIRSMIVTSPAGRPRISEVKRRAEQLHL